MQSNMLFKVKNLLNQKYHNIDIDKFIKFLSNIKENEYIYPSSVYKFSNSNTDIYNIFEDLVSNGCVERCFETYCPFCNKPTENYYTSMVSLPKKFYCCNCGKENQNVIDYTFVVYKMR